MRVWGSACPACLRLFAVSLSCSLALLPPATCAQAQAGSRLRIAVLEGDGAINNIREGTAKAPVVRVEDDDGRPLEKVAVTFMLPENGASGTFANQTTSLTVFTGTDGIAAARVLRPNNVAGPFQIRVTASHRGETARATLSQTNATPARAAGRDSRRLLIILGLAGGAAAGAALALRGGGESTPAPVPSTPGGTVITPGSPVWGPPR